MLARDELIQSLRKQLQSTSQRPSCQRLSSGSQEIDKLLPENGFRRGSLVEWLGASGQGATTLALWAAREASRRAGSVVIVDPRRQFYPPAAVALGIDLEKLVLVRPDNLRDERWAMTQALACRGVAAVLCWPERLDSRTGRRLQLAAEQGASLGFLIRSAESEATKTTWSEIRLQVTTQVAAEGRPRYRIELLRARGDGQLGRTEGHAVEIELDDRGQICAAQPQLGTPRAATARPAATAMRRRAAGA